jgi:hypothetical protein
MVEISAPAPPFFDAAPRWPRPRGPKEAHLKEETKMNSFLLYSSLIRVLGAEQSAPKDRRKFLEKGGNIRGREHLTGREHSDRSCRYNKPVQYGRDAAHISWAGLRADPTWGLHGGEATPSERELFSRTENFMEERQHHLRESSSAGLRRSQKLEILPSPNSKSLDAYICGRQHLL